MAYNKKIVLFCPHGETQQLDRFVEQCVRDGVIFIGVVGQDCSRIEDIIDELLVGDGSNCHFILTSHHANETVEGALKFARSLTGEYAGDVQLVEL